MIETFKRFIAPPIFEDETITLRARMLNVTTLTVYLVVPVMLLGNLLEPVPSAYVFAAGVTGLLMAVWMRVLLFRGRVYAASVLWVVLFSLIVTVNAIVLGTVRSTNTAIFLINIAVAGWLLNGWAVLAVTAYNSLVVLGVLLAQQAGWLSVSRFVSESAVSLWFNYTALFLGMAMFMLVSTQVLSQSLAQKRREQNTLLRRDAIMRAVNFAAQQFLEVPDWRNSISLVLARLGEAVGSTHAYIFERHITPGGFFALSQRYEWVREGFPAEIDAPEYKDISLAKIESQPWYVELSNGQSMQANLATCGPEWAQYFGARGIKSILEIPIIVSGQWWGVLGLDDFVNMREWSPGEVETIEIAATTLGLAIQRQRNEQALRQREAILEVAAFSAQSFLQSADWRDEIDKVLEHIGQATESSHVYLFENHPLPDGRAGTSQRFEWVAPGCKPDIENPTFQNMSIVEEHSRPWLEKMQAGQVYYCNLDMLPESVRQMYLARGLLTYLDAPIYVNGVWWGIMGMDDNFRVRNWLQVELDAIQVAASTLGLAIQRQLRDEAFRKVEQAHREELEQRVKERTQQLQGALQEIEGVSFTASHDLRTPLRAVDGYASILLSDHSQNLDGEQNAYIFKIKQAAQHMARLLDDLIHLIRYSRQPINKQQLDLAHTARHVLRDLMNRHPGRRVEMKIAEQLPAFGDRALLGVVIEELVDNAWKFTAGREQAEIEFGINRQNGQAIYFLRDNGIGFDMTYVGKLFRNFEQLHQPGMVEGTGMGLATVHRIIVRHGGRIWAEGRLDEGSTFYFTLPEA